ncbi:hypothetical protein LIER_35101 [Lithospermum erythrorhizon]|uniref:Uncharacterized protein n=1 Tax=Lithospermum erythrorhizon TaxID=34254 RepID=A0AAV3NKQ3_LITER
MADQSATRPSEATQVPPVLQRSHEEVRLARAVAEIGGIAPKPTRVSVPRILDDSQAHLDVQPLNSQMGPPPPRPAVLKSSKGKPAKDQPTLEEVRAKTVPGTITDFQLRQIRKHYGFPKEVKTRIPVEGENVDSPLVLIRPSTEGVPKEASNPTSQDTSLFWEFFNYGLRPPVSSFVDEVLTTVDWAPGQLMSFLYLILTVFQVACLAVEVIPNVELFSVM